MAKYCIDFCSWVMGNVPIAYDEEINSVKTDNAEEDEYGECETISIEEEKEE